MKNIDRLVNHITKHGAEGLIVHTIYGTSNWIIGQKIEKDKWLLSLENPMGNVTYNLGTVTNDQHSALWTELIRTEIEKKASQIRIANELRNKINNFKKSYENNYKNFIQKEKTKQKRPQHRRRNTRPKKTNK